MMLRKILERFDWLVLAAVILLTTIGAIVLYGIGISHEPPNFFILYKQLAAAGIGLLLLVFLTMQDYRHWRQLSLLIYGFGLLLLILVLLFGTSFHGTQGWFRFGLLSFQPVEIAKLTLLIYLASFFSRYAHERLSWRMFILSGCAMFGYFFFILLQPDFGSAMVLMLSWFCLAIFAKLPRKALSILTLLLVLMSVLFWSFVFKPYQRDRFLTFFHPERDPRGAGYHAVQARIAIGSGGWFGRGVGESSQARLRFLPGASTDFAFAVVGEELGFVGVTFLLGFFFLLLWRLIHIAREAPDDFAALLVIGVLVYFLLHILINAGMNIGIMPITGIPLPFVSGAASSIVAEFIGLGLVESVAVRIVKRGKEEG